MADCEHQLGDLVLMASAEPCLALGCEAETGQYLWDGERFLPICPDHQPMTQDQFRPRRVLSKEAQVGHQVYDLLVGIRYAPTASGPLGVGELLRTRTHAPFIRAELAGGQVVSGPIRVLDTVGPGERFMLEIGGHQVPERDVFAFTLFNELPPLTE